MIGWGKVIGADGHLGFNQPTPAPTADRYCAWASRTGDRLVFAVRPLAPTNDGWASVAPGVLLGVQHEAGVRRVVWSTVVGGGGHALRLHRAVADLRRSGCGELHHLAVAGGPAACARVASELGKPSLTEDRLLPMAC